jgi:PHD/YefM family antitoxin component YafN of YafNO toxin-antitoxin module
MKHTRPARYAARAAEYREMARETAEPDLKRKLLRVAEGYEELARIVESSGIRRLRSA